MVVEEEELGCKDEVAAEGAGSHEVNCCKVAAAVGISVGASFLTQLYLVIQYDDMDCSRSATRPAAVSSQPRM